MSEKLIVTIESRLNTKYGAQGAAAIAERLAAYAIADAARGCSSRVLYLDAPGRTGFEIPALTHTAPARVGFPPDEPEGPALNASIRAVNEYARAIKRVIDAARRSFAFDALLIVGGNEIIPFFRAPNPLRAVGVADDDTTVPTDNPYGTVTVDASQDMYSFLLPDTPTGRLPDIDGESDAAYLLGTLTSAIAQAQRETEDDAPRPAGWVLTTETWQSLTEHILIQNGMAVSCLEISPPITVDSFPTTSCARKNLHYFNVHGGLGTGLWWGESSAGFVDAFGPALIRTLQVPAGAGIVTEACYGADLLGRGQADSCALTYLSVGCAAYAGASTTAYGCASAPALCADIVAEEFLTAIQTGASVGRSLLQARQKLANSTTQFGGLTPAETKTLFQFYLLGDPSHRPFCGHPVGRAEAELTTAVEISTKLRGMMLPALFPKRTGAAAMAELPDLAHTWRSEIDARLPGLRYTGERVEVLGEMPAKPTRDVTRSTPQARPIIAVHRLYVGEPLKTNHPEARVPKPVFLASAYFSEGRLLREAVVKSR